MGIGICIGVFILSLVVARFHGSFKLGQAVYFIFVGLLCASIWPSAPQATHDFVTSLTTSITHTNIQK